MELGALRDVFEVIDDSRRIEVDRQFFQFDAMNGNLKEACNSCGAGVFATWGSEGKRFQLGQGHGKVGDIVIV